MNNVLVFKGFLTSEREIMFKEISQAIHHICVDLKSKRQLDDSKKIEAIMTDLTSHCGRQFKKSLAPGCNLGHTLFHVTACIQQNIFKDKGLRKLFYKNPVARGYCRSLMYLQFSNQEEIMIVYQFLKRILIRLSNTASTVFETLEKCVIKSTKIPIKNLCNEDKVKHRNEPTEAQHKM